MSAVFYIVLLDYFDTNDYKGEIYLSTILIAAYWCLLTKLNTNDLARFTHISYAIFENSKNNWAGLSIGGANARSNDFLKATVKRKHVKQISGFHSWHLAPCLFQYFRRWHIVVSGGGAFQKYPPKYHRQPLFVHNWMTRWHKQVATFALDPAKWVVLFVKIYPWCR